MTDAASAPDRAREQALLACIHQRFPHLAENERELVWHARLIAEDFFAGYDARQPQIDALTERVRVLEVVLQHAYDRAQDEPDSDRGSD